MMQIDLQCAFLMGATMAVMARRRLPDADRAWWLDVYGWTYVVGGVAFAPTWLYITMRWPAWETQYRWDLDTIPVWLMAAFLPAITIACKAGFWITAKLLQHSSPWIAALPSLIAGGSIAHNLATNLDRVLFVGGLADYHPGVAPNLWSSDLVRFFGVATLLVFVPFALLVRHAVRRASR
jgi:hypothetical protein